MPFFYAARAGCPIALDSRLKWRRVRAHFSSPQMPVTALRTSLAALRRNLSLEQRAVLDLASKFHAVLSPLQAARLVTSFFPKHISPLLLVDTIAWAAARRG